MKSSAVPFDLARFGGVRPLISGEAVLSGPSGPSGPSKNPLLIVEEKGANREVGKTIGITGTTRTTGTSPPPASAPIFRYAGDRMELGDVCAGWTPSCWAVELRRKAQHCEAYRPDIADYYRRWAADIEARLGGGRTG